MKSNVVLAIFKRNFISYFSSPIGYVFICAFVLMTAFAAFWPHEFFNSNLANLDQLNRHLPWILLVFIPAITMSIWAEERRQGTDELLLTLPATDGSVVLGKYLAAVAIYTVSLLFSLSNIAVLAGLGDPDIGLLFANYLGYWIVGVAMLAVGMVASFLTSNLTVGFVLAAALNSPLVFAAWADAIIPGDDAARFVRNLSIAEHFRDFSRGVISVSSLAFFGSIIALMLYLSMVLIGRRHWSGERHRYALAGHYATRAVCLAAIFIGACALAARYDARLDVSSEKLSSLSPQTVTLLEELDPQRPAVIEAYISADVPEEYVPTRLNLLSMLREFDAMAGDDVVVRIHDTERFSAEAAQAQEQFGIAARPVQALEGGRFSVDEVFLGVAVMSGLDKVVIPFFDLGTPVEYELVRSIMTVCQQERKRIGVVTTDARLYGGFDMQTMSSRPDEMIIQELRKQYDVIQVDPSAPITETFDVLLAVQPSSMPAQAIANFVSAVRNGQPAAIFEDPYCAMDAGVAGTSQPRVPPGGSNPFMQREMPEPKGDITELWDLLQIDFTARDVIWQDYNPHPKLAEIPREVVFVAPGSGAEQAFNQDDAITAGLQEVVLPFPGAISFRSGSTMQLMPLMTTSAESGLMPFDEMLQRDFLGRTTINPARRFRPTPAEYILAARVGGAVKTVIPAAPDGESEPQATTSNIRAVVVGDIDLLYSTFFLMRQRGAREQDEVRLNFDNVTFVLNVLDDLAGDDRFVEIRKRRPVHRPLTAVEEQTEHARAAADDERERFMAEFEDAQAAERAHFDAKIRELQARTDVDAKAMLQEVAQAQQVGEQRLNATIESLQRQRDREVERIETNLALEVRRVQDTYKFLAVALPPIPPLILAVIVFFRRRAQERIGVPKERLRGA